MKSFPFDIVGFDLDGTLLDTSRDLAAALNHALAQSGRPAQSVAQVVPMIGGGARKMLAHGLAATGDCSEAELDRLFPLLIDFYHDNISGGTLPYPGMIASLDALQARGVRLAICTNKAEPLALKLLDELSLSDRFAAVIGGSPDRAPKPSAAPIHEMIARAGGGRAAFVGDSHFDMNAARHAGVPSVAVSFGFPGGPAGDLGADAVIDHYDDLIPALERLGG